MAIDVMDAVGATDEGAKLKILIDNRVGNRLYDAISSLAVQSRCLDIATGYFEIGIIVVLSPHWRAFSWETI